MSSAIAPSPSPVNTTSVWHRRLLTLLLLTVSIWIAIAACTNTALPHDMAEQFVWAQTWQWGYPKHPPLPTWLFKLFLAFLPVAPWSLYAVSAFCISATGWLTYLLAKELSDIQAATCALALWTLQQPFSWRAWMFNHNSVMVLCVALVAFALVKALKTSQLRWWLLVALASGLSMLTKFQAALPLCGLLWVLVRTGAWRQNQVKLGMALTLIVTAVMLVPYFWWVFHGHADSLEYAKHQLGEGKEGHGDRVLLFLTVNLRMLMLVLLVLLGWFVYALREVGMTDKPERLTTEAKAWIEGLFVIPLLGVIAVGSTGGSTVPGHWGVQTFQFVSLALMLAFRSTLSRVPVVGGILPVLGLHAFGMLIALSPAMPHLHAKGTVQGYPAKVLTQRIQADWQAATNCPLRYAAAPFFEGGQIAAMVPGFPAVFEDADLSKSPWIDTRDMARAGYVVLTHSPLDLPPDAVHNEAMFLRASMQAPEIGDAYWAIVLPTSPCQTGHQR